VKSNGIVAGITNDAIQALAAAFEGDLHSLAHEIAKLALLADKDQQIDLKLVSSICNGTPERSTFQLIQLIAQSNAAKANALLNDLLEQGLHPLQISGLLNRAFRIMLAKRASTSATKSLLHEDLTNNWFLRNIGGAAEQFSESDLNKTVQALCSLDMELKSSGLPAASHLESFVVRSALRAH
jgi:DNA polymerase III delta subunit